MREGTKEKGTRKTHARLRRFLEDHKQRIQKQEEGLAGGVQGEGMRGELWKNVGNWGT